MRKCTILALFSLLFFATSLGAQTSINPHTQVAWPSNCQLGATMAYNALTNTCFPAGNQLTFVGPWAIGTTYTINQVVYYGGISYVSLKNNNLAESPSTNPLFWAPLVSGGGGGGGGTPGGNEFSAQYNSAGSFAGASFNGFGVWSTTAAPRAAGMQDFTGLMAGGLSPSICHLQGNLFTQWGCMNINVTDDGSSTGVTPRNLTGLILKYNAYGPAGVGWGEGRSTAILGDSDVMAHAGIKNIWASSTAFYGIGDSLFMNWNHNCHTGTAYAADQGCQIIYNYGGQGYAGGHLNGSIASSTGAGDTSPVIDPNSIGGCNNPLNQNCKLSPGTALLDTAAAVATGSLTGPSVGSVIPWLSQLPTTGSMPTASAYGYNESVSISPNTTWDAPLPVTVTMTNGAGALHTGLACAIGDEFEEQSIITAVSGSAPTQTITLGLAKPENKLAIFQGACRQMQFNANAANAQYSTYPVVSVDGTNLIYVNPGYASTNSGTIPIAGAMFASTGGTGDPNAAITLWCGARVTKLNSLSPMTESLEPNDCAWNPGDAVSDPDFSMQKVNGIVNTSIQNEPSISQASLAGITTSIDGPGAAGSAIGIANNNFYSHNCAKYAIGTCGGRLSPPLANYLGGVWGNWFVGDYAPSGSLFLFNDKYPGQTGYNIISDAWGSFSLNSAHEYHMINSSLVLDQGSVTAQGQLSAGVGLYSGTGNGAGNMAGVGFHFAGSGGADTWLAQCNLNPFTLISADLCVTSQGASRNTYVAAPDRGLQAYDLTAAHTLNLNATATPGVDTASINFSKLWSGNAGYSEALGVNFHDLGNYDLGGLVATTQLYPGIGLYVPASLAFTGSGTGGMAFITRADVHSLPQPGDITFSAAGYNPAVPNLRLPGGTSDAVFGGVVTAPTVTATTALRTASYTVAALPSAATSGAGALVRVSDAASYTVGTCTGGGTSTMLAVSDGTSWTCH